MLASPMLVLDPPSWTPHTFRDDGPNLFQINIQGRVVQVVFEAVPELVSTEDFRVPYTLSGVIRAFNQNLLDRNLIEEQLLFYTMEKHQNLWRVFDARTYRTGPLDVDYLAALLEELV